MFKLFDRGPLLDSDVVEWLFDSFACLLRHTGGYETFKGTRLIKPIDSFFPQAGLRDQDFAEDLFLQVKEHCGMSEWPCRLEPQEEDWRMSLAPGIGMQATPSPGGTFSYPEDGAVVTYNPNALADPMVLVATFSHELAHYLISGFPEPPPGGWDKLEFFTDVASVFLGFGVFAANSAFAPYTMADGWRTTSVTYLMEPELLYALAIFSTLLEIPPKEVSKHLRPSLRSVYRRACREVEAQKERLSALKAVEPARSEENVAAEVAAPRPTKSRAPRRRSRTRLSKTLKTR